MRPFAQVFLLAALLVPATELAIAPAIAAETSTAHAGQSGQPNDPAHPHNGDDRPRIEEHHEELQGAELFILGGAFVAALGIAYRVGKLSSARKTAKSNEEESE